MLMSAIVAGATVAMTFTSRQAITGALTDAVAVSVKIDAPDATSQTLTLGNGVTNTAVGIYLATFTALQYAPAGTPYTWTATFSYDDGNSGFWYGVATGSFTTEQSLAP